MKLNTKRGLSDVVTTGLIILLAIAAVVIVWSFIRPALTNVGESVSTSGSCFGVEVKPTGCDPTTNTVHVQVVSVGSGATISGVKAIVSDPVTGANVVGSAAASNDDELSTVQVDVTEDGGIDIDDIATAAAVIQGPSGNDVTCQESIEKIIC